MGLLLSVLVVCVGVVEVIACVRHFQSSYLPLWAPHRIAPGYTDVHELWRTKPNSDLDYRAPLGAVASSKQIFCRENAVRYCVKQHDTTGQVQEEGILSDVDSAKNVFGSVAYSALSPHENVCESGETHSDDSLQKLFGDITSIENNLGSSHCCDWNIDIQSSDSLSPGTEQPFLPSCPCAEDFGPYPSDVVRKDSEEIASQDEIGNKILKVISSQQVSDEPTEVPYSHTEFSSRGVETGEDFPVDPVCVVALEPCPVELLDEKLLTEPADETGDVSEEDIPPCSVERKKCPSACEDGFKNTADEVFEIANAVSSSACTHDFTTSADEVFQIADPVASSSGPLPPSPSGTVDSLHKPVGIEHSHPCNVKTGEDFIFNKDKEYPYVVRSPLSTPSTPRKSKADIKWPTFTADPVIKRPSVALTNTFTSFDSFDLSADSPEVIDESSGNKDSEAVDESEKSEKQFAHDKVHAKEGAGKELSGSPAVDSGTGESRDTGDSNFSDMELLGETSISVIPGKEFSKKEIMLKRRRSYKSRRQSSSAESASGSEKDDRSFGEEKTGARESRRRFRKSSKYNSAEDASYFEEARTSSSHLSRVLSNPESDSAKKLLEEWQACSGVEPDELGPTSRNKWIVPESLARGVETVAEEVVHQVDNGVMQDVTESNNVATASGDIPMLNNSSGSQTQTANEDLNDAKKDTSKEAFWVSL